MLGPRHDLVRLATYAFGEVGASYRPFGDEATVRELAHRLAGLEFRACFGWMDTAVTPVVEGAAAWLDDLAGIAELLDLASPESYA